MNDSLADAIRRDFRTADISGQDRVMLEYAETLTRDATRIGKADHEKLRAVGFDDKAILQITLIAAWFNYVNRVADALGVGRDQAGPRGAARASRRRPRSPGRRAGRRART
jgi:uncharacterized peroxidase-related enzyme